MALSSLCDDVMGAVGDVMGAVADAVLHAPTRRAQGNPRWSATRPSGVPAMA